MSTFGLPLSRIDAACLDSLVANGIAESRQLEYKERLPGGDEKAKHEFLADVSSFANRVGGDLIYGVRAARDAGGVATGTPEAIVGLPDVNFDQEQLRLEALLLHGVDPRIPGVLLHRILRGSDPPCLLIRILQSPLRLHMVTLGGGGSRFYGRGASGRVQLDVRQIRTGFLELEAAEERLRRFRLDRVARVAAGETPIPMGDEGKLIFHALPLTPLNVWPSFVKMAENQAQIPNLLAPMFGSTNDWRWNLDGFVAYTTSSERSRQTYIQLFRDGGIEAAGSILNCARSRGEFYGLAIEKATIPVLKRTQGLWKLLGVTGQIVLGLAMSGIKGWKMLVEPYSAWDPKGTFDTDLAILPEVVAQDETSPAERALKPLFDLAWNAGGYSESPFYDESTGERRKELR